MPYRIRLNHIAGTSTLTMYLLMIEVFFTNYVATRKIATKIEIYKTVYEVTFNEFDTGIINFYF